MYIWYNYAREHGASIYKYIVSPNSKEMGEPLIGVNPASQVGELEFPNPSANLIGVLQALGIVKFCRRFFMCKI